MKKKPLFRTVICAALIGSLLTPGAVHAESGTKAKADTQNKIAAALYKSFAKEDKVTFLIKMKDQANPQQTAEAAEKRAKLSVMTVKRVKELKRSAVLTSLRTKAERTQKNLKAFLEKEEKKGHAKQLESFYIVNGMAVTATKDVMEKAASYPEVEKVLPNEKIKLSETEKATIDSTKSSAAHPASNIRQVHAPDVWKKHYKGKGAVVASIDTGVEWDHPALKTKYRGYNPDKPNSPNNQYNWFDATSKSKKTPYDDLGHGTHVTGTMVGSEAGGKNEIGVAPTAKWIAVKAFSEDGGSEKDLLAAGEWILAPTDAKGKAHPEKAPDVVNNSWAGERGLNEWYRDMVKAWRAADIFPSFAAGNVSEFEPGGPGSVENPSNYPESFAIGAVDSENSLADFSLQGPSPYDEIKPDLSAPGVSIRSAYPGHRYAIMDGTSMATPHISGIVALMREVNPNISVDEIERILLKTATPLSDKTFTKSPNNGYGYGLVNALKAFNEAKKSK
ncbi:MULTISPECIES: S8 family serine peptidase [unclassified Bacillus (in: firmicutes)]|uniref:S8 family serine peptidase n=1 Tax=unclassified Bacillus (in: firmicutes) TaxID=185979 RepID=UPI0004236430|nr:MULTISPECIES: S8 family serine peptidase [unclassified Bacillus (in: firmicutes)]QHZ46714.1 S8 family serine peptidase [Bacillus sp. NSP9.1]WFA06845.1 S8 family serine peptidase [Bacillus sp. HSf4]